jgi:hypothetical protein
MAEIAGMEVRAAGGAVIIELRGADVLSPPFCEDGECRADVMAGLTPEQAIALAIRLLEAALAARRGA